MDRTFAELVDEGARGLGLNDYQLSAAIGLLEGNRVYSPKQVHRLRAGEVRHPDPELVRRLIQVLALNAEEAYFAAGIWPPDLDLEGYRRFRQLASAHGNKHSTWNIRTAGQPPQVPVAPGLDELIEPLRHPGDRRRRRRTDPPVAPQLVLAA